MSFFKKIDISIPVDKQSEKLDNQFLYYEDNPEIYFVTDDFGTKQLSYIKRAMQKVFKGNIPHFAVLYAFKYKATDKEITKNITNFVYAYTCDYSKYIPKNSKVVCIGRAIYSFTFETSFTAEAFFPYDYVNTYFFHPLSKSYIFPVTSFYTFTAYDQKRYLDNFESFFFFKQIQRAYDFKAPNIRLPELVVNVVEDPNAFLIEMKDKVTEVAWDLETSGLIYYKDSITCITMSFDGVTGYYLDMNKTDLNILDDFFKDKYQIGANLKFDCRFLKNLGLKNVKIDFDTLNAGHVLNETASNSLSSHGWRYTYYGGHEIELHKYKKKHPKINYAQIPRSILAPYATKDAIICYQVYKKQLQMLNEVPELCSYYFKDVVPSINLFLDIELGGILIDWNYLKDLSAKFEQEKAHLESEIFDLLGFKVNLSSNKDLAKALEFNAKFPDIGKRAKSGAYLTNEAALNEWAQMGYEVAAKLIEYRSVCHQMSSFIGEEGDDSAYWKYKNGDLDTIHPSYSVMLASSQRNRCSSPNLQQVPKRTASAQDFRKIFIAPEEEFDYVMSNDIIKIELDDGDILELLPSSKCIVNRKGTEIELTANELTNEDDFVKIAE